MLREAGQQGRHQSRRNVDSGLSEGVCGHMLKCRLYRTKPRNGIRCKSQQFPNLGRRINVLLNLRIGLLIGVITPFFNHVFRERGGQSLFIHQCIAIYNRGQQVNTFVRQLINRTLSIGKCSRTQADGNVFWGGVS